MNQYKTSDFNIACVLKTLGYRIVEITGNKGDKRRDIVFEDDGSIPQAILAYENGEVNENLKQFIVSQDTIKRLIFS